MKAMILAAGRGERMRPMTDSVPKSLLQAGGRTLIEYSIDMLRRGGIDEIVVNHAHLGEQIVDFIGNGDRFGVSITYSDESAGALETGGGIRKALPLLGKEPFVVINSDIWTDFPIERLPKSLSGLAHLVLTDNPPHHTAGDFCLDGSAVNLNHDRRLTFTGIGMYSPQLFNDIKEEYFPLTRVLLKAMSAGQVSGQCYRGKWMDIGTPERLRALDAVLRQ